MNQVFRAFQEVALPGYERIAIVAHALVALAGGASADRGLELFYNELEVGFDFRGH